jgi:hypothetical protein
MPETKFLSTSRPPKPDGQRCVICRKDLPKARGNIVAGNAVMIRIQEVPTPPASCSLFGLDTRLLF